MEFLLCTSMIFIEIFFHFLQIYICVEGKDLSYLNSIKAES